MGELIEPGVTGIGVENDGVGFEGIGGPGVGGLLDNAMLSLVSIAAALRRPTERSRRKREAVDDHLFLG